MTIDRPLPMTPHRPLSVTSPMRVLLYSHDSWGLGHLRRSLAIAGALTRRFDHADALVVTGSPCATQFPLPPRCDLVKLPAVTKDPDGTYTPRSLSGSLDSTLEIRQRILLEAFRAFAPTLLIVDHQLTGLRGEALPILHEARAQGVRTIYGMRDVLDTPDVVQSSWDSHACRWALREGYDCLCIYGSPAIFDATAEYPILEQFAGRLEFTGYIVPDNHRHRRRPLPHARKQVLVTVGGGEDGRLRINRYLQALALGPCDWDSHIFTGPLMDPELARHYKRAARKLGRLATVQVHRFHTDLPGLLDEADAVVSMAGYNSCAEILQSRCRAVLLPRIFPRREQAIRAQRLERHGLADTLDDPSPAALRRSVELALRSDSRPAVPVDLGGLDRLCEIVADLTRPLPATVAPARLCSGAPG